MPQDEQGAKRELDAGKLGLEAQLEQAKTEVAIEKIRRGAQEAAEKRRRKRRSREAKERRREERRATRRRFLASIHANWDRHQESLQGQSGTMRVLTALGIPAFVALVIYALPSSSKVLATGLLTATASFAVGAFLGFLFGIPRSVGTQATETKAAVAKTGDKTAGSVATVQQFAPNTNLEQISDWLTKILVGVGLVQVHQIGSAIDDLASGLTPGLGATTNAVAVALMVSFSITGFVSAYLFTRLRLQSAFELATAIKQAVKERADTETSAIAVVQKQLDPGGGEPPTLQELAGSLRAATPGIRAQAFFLAREQRRENWHNNAERGENRALVAPTIPVFEALIDCDPPGRYHRARAELGYALKDQENADPQGALVAFKKAIELRPETEAKQFFLYEFNLAYCEIELDRQGFAVGKASADAIVNPVCANLAFAAQFAIGRDAIGETDEDGKPGIVQRWLTLNKEQPAVEAIEGALANDAG